MAKVKIHDKKVKFAIMKVKKKKGKADSETDPELPIESDSPICDDLPDVSQPDLNVSSETHEDEGNDLRHSAEESDSSEDEVAPRNTIGDVPLEWYKDEEHIGYDITGRKIKKHARKDKIESFLAGVDDSKNWRKIYDEYNDEEVELTKKDFKLIKRLLTGSTPHAEVDPYAPYVDWFDWEDKGHPLSNAPEPKRRFIPSKWEQKKVVQYIRAIRKGWIKFEKPKEEPRYYLLWGEDSNSAENKRQGLKYIPAPKPKLAGHEESYNPSLEYIPTQEEINSYQLMYEEDRPKFIPRRFESLRNVPAYENALKEGFDRCLDLYLCPRTRKKRINIDPESLKPKLPSRKDLKPYPSKCYLEYLGHSGPVKSISVEILGQWLASGSSDGTVRLWEVETGRCLKVWDVGQSVHHVAWNPLPKLPILAVAAGHDVLLLDTGLGDPEEQQRITELLHCEESTPVDDEDLVSWAREEMYGGIRLKHAKAVTTVEWHRKGDYFTTVMPRGDTKAVLLHQLSKKQTHNPFKKLRGLAVSAVFHPTRSIFFISTKNHIRIYDLLKSKLINKLETGLQEVSSMAVHPGGDNLIVGSKEGKMCWFDMDLSSRPYKILKTHPKDITNVAFHRSYPLFASSSEDCTAYVFHGTVYSDLNQNPLIVPLEILRGHASSKHGGVLDCAFHPRQPWLFTAGADSVIKLYCH
ncbi:ribosome biogenesis protein BOP1 homolog [Phalaenopsis equestris]|uniref:ribosome biogenesis protein BOP1 homolog n=1 Tax=Phalaenopsis equestris TaxID=78828 RepID=UPI0009E3DF7E|nr:ribosome biogenesis protein BOP1 homolog [Phalaenopsis equestris]XP_020580485.1 ribosome biogenesis protein BOP1 homolog [Phalaenopsis equestris]